MRSGRPGPLVELLGLPGSGKSSLADAVTAAVPGVRRPELAVASGVAAPVRLTHKLAASATVTATAPALSAGLWLDLWRTSPSRADAPSRWVQWQQTQALVRAARRRGGPHLLDEGVLQCLWSIGLRGNLERVLDRLGHHAWAGPDVVVVVDVPAEVADARLGDRTSRHSRTQALPPQARRAELERGTRLVVDVLAWWTARSGRAVPVVCVDGTAEPTDAVARIAGLLSPDAARG